jgi:single-stranded-DNA-specific exonuclease
VSEKDNLSPLLLNNIETATKIILKHISNDKAKIYVQTDADCDGMLSSALLLNYLYKQFPSSIDKFYYDFHEGKTHGIELQSIQEGTTLVIVPDASSNEYSTHQELKEKGIDVVVLDHHLAERVSEYACVVNNQLCDYPTKSLCGTGIVYKLCQYIDSICGSQYAEDYIDIVGLAEVGDMMSLTDFETRYLVQTGLQRANLRNPFIVSMAEKNSYQLGTGDLTPIGVAFYIVPLVNAITRVGTQEEKRLVFDSMLEWKAYKMVPSTKRGHKGEEEALVEQAVRACTNVKNRQTKFQEAGVQEVEKLIQERELLNHKLLLIQVEPGEIEPSIRGLICNKLMGEYKRPVAILTRGQLNGESVWAGSARGYDKSQLKDFRKFCLNSPFDVLGQGHSNAFGLTIKDQDFKNFIEWSDEELKNIEFSPSYMVDFIYPAKGVNPKDILELGDAENLWGQDIDEPLVAIENLPITKDMLTLMSRDKKPTLKIQLLNGVACIKFKSGEEEFDNLYSENGCVNINLVGKPKTNRYLNSITPQIIVQDYEIINKQDYYF